ncbi:hypothetical protein KKI24_07315 [bacterium]|nr:hypothetical protein [bacterium]
MIKKVFRLDLEQIKKSVADKFYRSTDKFQEKIGLELESFPFAKSEAGKLIPAEIVEDTGSGTFDLIRQDALLNRGSFIPGNDDGTHVLVSTSGGQLSYEPGGQLEYSSSSREDLKSVIREVSEHVGRIEAILAENEIRLFHGAINPWYGVEEVGLKMRKPRYRAMDRYFAEIGPYGQQMMRLTASLQVNLDFGDRETAGKRWLAANLLAPVFNAIFGNSPFMGRQYTDTRSYRSLVWQKLDPSRTGFPHLSNIPGTETQPEAQYRHFALNAAVFMLPDEDGVPGYRTNHFTFQQWMDNGFNGWFPEMADWETHLTTLFPEVRPKGFMECRFVDGLSKAWWPIPAILLSSIIYSAEATEAVISLLKKDFQRLGKMQHRASIAGVSAFPEIARRVFEIGLQSTRYQAEPDLLAYCERFYLNYTYLGRSPADELIRLNNWAVFDMHQYDEFDKRTLDIAEPPEYALINPLPLENPAEPVIRSIHPDPVIQTPVISKANCFGLSC